jgi:hypothetical protein
MMSITVEKLEQRGDVSVDELTAEVAQQRTIGDFPPLPSNVTRFQIRLWGSAKLKRMIKKHGLKSINEVLARAD